MKSEWRCQNCGTLLGVHRPGGLYLRYKQMQYTVSGKEVVVAAVCRSCSLSNETVTRPGTAA